jgi:hypothetical protein
MIENYFSLEKYLGFFFAISVTVGNLGLVKLLSYKSSVTQVTIGQLVKSIIQILFGKAILILCILISYKYRQSLDFTDLMLAFVVSLITTLLILYYLYRHQDRAFK